MLKRNLVANYAGQAWTALVGVAFVPLYIRYLGMEAYGVVGVFAVLQGWLVLLDMGLTPALSREMTRFREGGLDSASIRDVLRTVEVVTCAIACLALLAIWASSDWISTNWLRAEHLPTQVVAVAIALMGLMMGLRLLEGVYRGAAMGLEQLVALNVVTAVLTTLRAVGAVAVLAWLSRSVIAFFLWQAFASLLTVAALMFLTYAELPRSARRASMSLRALRTIWRFAAGVLATTVLALLLTQLDKIILSRTLTLSDFGYYTFAALAAGVLYSLMVPVTQAAFPRLCAQAASGDASGFAATFHKAAQVMTVVAGSAAIVVGLFSDVLVRLWTRNDDLVQHVSHLITLLVLGNMLHGFAGVPYQAQLAVAWTRLGLVANSVAVLVIVPAILLGVPRYGAEAAAVVWLALTAGYVAFTGHAFFSRFSGLGKLQWYRDDLAYPLLGAAVGPVLVRLSLPVPSGAIEQSALLVGASLISLSGSVLMASHVRHAVLRQFTQLTRKAVHG